MSIDIVAFLLTFIIGATAPAAVHEYQPSSAPAEWVATLEQPPDLDRCAVITIDWTSGQAVQTGKTYVNLEPWQIRTDLVGPYLWTQFDKKTPVSDVYEDTSSVLLEPGTTRVEICR